MAKADARILRIGIIQGGKIVEERLLRRHEPVTIGQSPKNTFYVPISKLPRSHVLFDVKGEQYLLALHDGCDGRVSFDEKVQSIAELKANPKAVKKGAVPFLPLTEKNRGKIVLGDITILFQFVPPPPVVPKPQLPASARGGIGQALMAESAFLLAILASLVVQGGFIALSMAFETPPEKVKKKNRYLQALKVDVEFNQKEEDKEEPDKADAKKEADAEKEGEKELEVADPEPPPMPEPPSEKQRRPQPEKQVEKTTASRPGKTDLEELKRRRREKVRNNTILKHITSTAPGGTAGPDALREGHSQRFADAFKTDGGVTVGEPGDIAGFRGGPKIEGSDGSSSPARVAHLSAKERGDEQLKTGKVEVAEKKTERKVKLRVGLKGGTKSGGIGKLDGSVVTRVFQRRASAFRACYESRLKVNPNLSGKVVIRFTIGTAGRITNISVASNSTGDTAVGSCIVGKVRDWRFSPPEDGAVTFTYPIVLSKG